MAYMKASPVGCGGHCLTMTAGNSPRYPPDLGEAASIRGICQSPTQAAMVVRNSPTFAVRSYLCRQPTQPIENNDETRHNGQQLGKP